MIVKNLAVLILRIIELAVATADSLTIRVLSLRRDAHAALFLTTQVLALLRVVLVRLTQVITELLRRPALATDRIAVIALYGRAGQIDADLVARLLGIVDNLALALR
jgi:hypothetical protein